MLAIKIIEPRVIDLVETKKPSPEPNEVLVQVMATGICGTDLHIYKGDYEASYPITPGHEFSGIVESVGDCVKSFSPGDRVTVDPNISCDNCTQCSQGNFNHCLNHAAIGVTRDGAFAEYVIAPEKAVYKIGDMSFDVGAMVEPLACVMWGINRIQVQPGDSAMVFGAGPMGCLITQALIGSGAARVVVADLEKTRLQIAHNLGATEIIQAPFTIDEILELEKEGFDIAVDATGKSKILEETFAYIRPMGKIWVFGVVPPTEKSSYYPYEVFRRDLAIIGSFALNKTFPEAISFIKSGKVKFDDLITHKFPLTSFEEAFDTAENHPERMKIQFKING